jgi:hypothetical protein
MATWTFPFADARAAYRHFEGRGHFGNVVITHGWKMVISVVTFRRGCGRSRV